MLTCALEVACGHVGRASPLSPAAPVVNERALLPLRWYQQILFNQVARGSLVHASAAPFAFFAGMALGLLALTWLCDAQNAQQGWVRDGPPEAQFPVGSRSAAGSVLLGSMHRPTPKREKVKLVA